MASLGLSGPLLSPKNNLLSPPDVATLTLHALNLLKRPKNITLYFLFSTFHLFPKFNFLNIYLPPFLPYNIRKSAPIGLPSTCRSCVDHRSRPRCTCERSNLLFMNVNPHHITSAATQSKREKAKAEDPRQYRAQRQTLYKKRM